MTPSFASTVPFPLDFQDFYPIRNDRSDSPLPLSPILFFSTPTQDSSDYTTKFPSGRFATSTKSDNHDQHHRYVNNLTSSGIFHRPLSAITARETHASIEAWNGYGSSTPVGRDD